MGRGAHSYPDRHQFAGRIPVEPAPDRDGAGSAWYLRLSDLHSVANRRTTDRVHLVIDCSANDWLTEQLRAASG
jgi:hypothetical protein